MRFCAVILFTLAVSATARAQDLRIEGREVVADRFAPHRFSDSILFVKGTRSLNHLELHSTMFLGLLEGPVDNYITPETDHIRIGSLVGRRYGGELSAMIGVLGDAEAGLTLPFIARQFRSDAADIAYGDLDGSAIGDPLLHGKYSLFGSGAWSGAALASVSFPLGSGDAYGGRDGFGAQLGFALGWEVGDLRVVGNADYVLQPEVENISVPSDDEIQLSAGVAYALAGIPLGVDLAVMHVTAASSPWGSLRGATGTEIIGGVRYPVDTHFEVTVGGGLAASEAFGIPSWRAFAGVRALGFDLVPAADTGEDPGNAPGEESIDVVEPAAEATPEEPPAPEPSPETPEEPVEEAVEEVVDAPAAGPPDFDEDGMPDAQDVCPTVAGSLSDAGCESPQVFALDVGGAVVLSESFRFRRNRAQPVSRSKKALESLGEKLAAHPNIETLTVT
ncbi:MAG: thrombospondin type 3 repeat-containing protein, partial [Myxococcota bacterium]